MIDLLQKQYFNASTESRSEEEYQSRIDKIFDKAAIVCEPWFDSSIEQAGIDYQRLEFLIALAEAEGHTARLEDIISDYISRLCQSSNDNAELIKYFANRGYYVRGNRLKNALTNAHINNFKILLETAYFTPDKKLELFIQAMMSKKMNFCIAMLSHWGEDFPLNQKLKKYDGEWFERVSPLMLAVMMGMPSMIALFLALEVEIPPPVELIKNSGGSDKIFRKNIYQAIGYKKRLTHIEKQHIHQLIYNAHMLDKRPTLHHPDIQALFKKLEPETVNEIILLYNSRHPDKVHPLEIHALTSIASVSIFAIPARFNDEEASSVVQRPRMVKLD